MIPFLYMLAFRFKHVDMTFSPYRARPAFHECLEWYPVTRRAWKRALLIRDQEMNEIKTALESKGESLNI